MLDPSQLTDSELYSGRRRYSSAYFDEDTGIFTTTACSFMGGGAPFEELILVNNTINEGGCGCGSGTAGPPGPQGPQGTPGSPGTPGLVPVTNVTTTPYDALLTDYMIAVNVQGPSSVVLPASPTGTVFIVKDTSGTASTNPITITASTTIDGAANAIINTDYGSLTFIFNGTEWNIV
jgi:hypothetical protein